MEPTKRALPYLSAITPPNKTKRIKGNVRANITKLNEVALPSGRSQMAAAYLSYLSHGLIEVRSAGSMPADQINPAVVAAMLEEDIDISKNIPKILTTEAVQDSDYVITMGCGSCSS